MLQVSRSLLIARRSLETQTRELPSPTPHGMRLSKWDPAIQSSKSAEGDWEVQLRQNRSVISFSPFWTTLWVVHHRRAALRLVTLTLPSRLEQTTPQAS